MTIPAEVVAQIRDAIQLDRLLDTAVALVEVPSPTRSAAAVSDRLATLLREDGFDVERPVAGWSESPAVAARFRADAEGRTIQFNGHLDTVHLPFVPPRIENGCLYGSGSSDMKGGIAAMVEAMRALRDTGTLGSGGVLLTAHDLHEIPWGDGSQLDQLIDAGYVGDAVMLPEYHCASLPVIGRGLAVLEAVITREGAPMHEVLGGAEQPNVIRAGADLVERVLKTSEQLAELNDPLAGRESMFVGQIHAGEIYNQSPTELRLSGTRRWLPGTSADDARRDYLQLLDEIAQRHGVNVEGKFQIARDAFALDESHPFVAAFQTGYREATGETLPRGAKPFVDDGNEFIRRGGVPAITHGPNAVGAHTLNEETPVEELRRVALVYALTAVAFCGS